MTNTNKKASLNKVIIIYVVIILLIAIGVVLYSMLWKVPLKLDALKLKLDVSKVESIEIDDFYIEGIQLVLDKEDDCNEIEEMVNIFNSSKNYRNDVGTTHPKRIRFMMENKSIVSLWYGTQGFITVSDGNNQFNMQNSELEHYFNKLLENP